MKTKRVLVVDDSPSIRKTIELIARNQNIEIAEATNTEEALKILNSQHPDIQAIILDLELKESSGLELLTTLQQNPAFCRLPIAIITGKSSFLDAEEEILAQGATLFLQKPLGSRKIASMLNQLIP